MKTEPDIIVIGDAGALAPSDAVEIDEQAGDHPLPKNAKLNADGSVTLTLFSAVTLKWGKAGEPPTEDVYTAFTMNRLKGADMTAIQDASRSELGMVAIARSVGMPVHKFKHVFARMDAADINAAGGVITYFLNNGLLIGR